ncbi:spore germination protein [Sporomusa acidovorans]|uniref:Spore germination protein XA n=1 Tax=Sporomusa acidovorans (strain ATCC 49682 / DSM 3132 / Mol) TaxID=1123286 RepID=A0ABZ3J440_SPOA4|nr:spore germination protein [Sporomusa acidovorans]OZC20330.1 spore germination protein XA [Sporomusa acidovorans DSM 3132]SDD37353.1 stage V sporulation protein AF [Sporomusa acidovorans]
MANEKTIAKELDTNINYIKDKLGVGESFDIIFREYKVGRKRAASFSINGMTNDVVLANVLEELTAYNQEELSINTMEKLFYSRATHSQVKLVENMNDAITSLLSGEMLFFVEGSDQVMVIDARSYPIRTPAESNIEKVTRGSRDSFVETIVFNTALIRRRLRDPNLRFEIIKVGTRSQCDIAICYIKDITNTQLIATVKDRLNNINIDGVPMAEKAIEEYIVKGSKWNPLPRVRYTERPDVAAVHLLEGHVCIIVDTSPNIMILPTTLWHHVQHVEEFHQNVIIGSYLRLIRLAGVLLSLILPPLWLAMVLNRHLLPESLAFLGPRDPGIIPIGIQFLLAEFGVELVRMATVHVPTAQSTALGFIGAFMLGDIATKVGLFGNETIFYTAVAAVGAFATPSMEFAMAIRLFRAIIIVLVMFFKLPGLAGGLAGVFLLMLTTKSFNIPYLWPALPFNFSAMKDVLFRLPIPNKILRPAVLKPQDQDRLESGGVQENDTKNKKNKEK